MFLAGIQKKSLDARLRGHDRWILPIYVELCLEAEKRGNEVLCWISGKSLPVC